MVANLTTTTTERTIFMSTTDTTQATATLDDPTPHECPRCGDEPRVVSRTRFGNADAPLEAHCPTCGYRGELP